MLTYRSSLFVSLFFVLCCSLSGCEEDNTPNNHVVLTENQEVVQITKWKMLSSEFMYEDKQSSILDGSLPNDLAAQGEEVALDDLLIYTAEEPILYSQDAGVAVSRMLGKDNNGVAYFFCSLESRTEQNVHLLFSGVQQAMLWLNNEMIYKTDWKSVQSKYYEEYIPFKLTKGKNLLLLKIGMTDRKAAVSRWTFNAFISNDRYAQENYLTDYKFTFLKRSVVSDSLTLYLGPYTQDSLEYDILNQADSIIISGDQRAVEEHAQSGTGSISLRHIGRKGLYKMRLFLDGDTLSQDFLYGDNSSLVDSLHRQYETLSRQFPSIKDNDSQIAVDRLHKMDNRSNSPNAYPEMARHWDLSRVYFYREIASYLEKLDKTASYHPYHGFIASYTSKIDDSKQYYSYHIPETLLKEDKKIPLIFIMPFTYYSNRYLDTWGISNFDQMGWEAKLARESGFGVVWVELRSHPGINDIAMTAFQEIVASLRTRINMDEDRLFLLGNSASSIKALTLATRLPDNFAGCMFYNTDLALDPLAQTYKNLENLSGMAMFFQHSTKDEIVPIKKAQSFFHSIKPYSIRSRFLTVDNNTHFVAPKDTYREGFRFMERISRERPDSIQIITEDLRYAERSGIKILEKQETGKASLTARIADSMITLHVNNVGKIELDPFKMGIAASKPISISVNGEMPEVDTVGRNLVLALRRATDGGLIKNNATEGPINHFFAHSFKAIYHTDNQPYAQLFENKWKKTYFTECPMVIESAVTKDLLKNNNILIFGTQTKHPLIRAVIKNLPIDKRDGQVYFREKAWDPNTTFISFIYPNPLNPKKYVYFIEPSKITNPEVWQRDFTNDFDFDYEIMEVSNRYHRTVEKGNFSNTWR